MGERYEKMEENIVFHRGEKIKLRYEVSFIFPQNRGIKRKEEVKCS